MLKHLRIKHAQEYDICKKDMKESEEKRKCLSTSSATQLTLFQTTSKHQQYSKDSARRKKIDQLLVSMIATDLQPISIVEDKGFKNLISTPDSRYESPSRRALMTTHFHENIRKELQAKLNNTSYVSLTTDLWTSLQTKSYCGVTVHYITNSWELRSAVLETFEFSSVHTAAHIDARVSCMWNIEQMLVCGVTCNASNMVAVISKTSWCHLPPTL
jgi:hypothetical protein